MLSSIEGTSNAATSIVDRHISDNAGDRLALRYGDKRYSYHDLAALMNRAGNMLRRLGVGPGDEILVAVAPSFALGERPGSNEDRCSGNRSAQEYR